MTNPPGLPGTFPILTLKALHAGKSLSSWHSRTVGHLSLVPDPLLMKDAQFKAQPAPLVTLQLCLPYVIGDTAHYPFQACELLSNTAHARGNAGTLKNRATLCYSLCPLPSVSGMKAARCPLISRRNARKFCHSTTRKSGSLGSEDTFPSNLTLNMSLVKWNLWLLLWLVSSILVFPQLCTWKSTPS